MIQREEPAYLCVLKVLASSTSNTSFNAIRVNRTTSHSAEVFPFKQSSGQLTRLQLSMLTSVSATLMSGRSNVNVLGGIPGVLVVRHSSGSCVPQAGGLSRLEGLSIWFRLSWGKRGLPPDAIRNGSR
jgi:hypothetical protein